jgi:hypothetical protein
VLHNDVLPSYRSLDLPVSTVPIDNGREFRGTEHPPYELHLDLNSSEHWRTNGFVERFDAPSSMILPGEDAQDILVNVEPGRADLDAWLVN